MTTKNPLSENFCKTFFIFFIFVFDFRLSFSFFKNIFQQSPKYEKPYGTKRF